MSGESMVIEDLGTDFSKFIPLEQGTPIELIQRSGLAGLGGAGFPTYVKMQSKLSADGTVILNAAECEPILNHNIARIEQEPGRLLDALQLAMTILSVRRGVIAIKSVLFFIIYWFTILKFNSFRSETKLFSIIPAIKSIKSIE